MELYLQILDIREAFTCICELFHVTNIHYLVEFVFNIVVEKPGGRDVFVPQGGTLDFFADADDAREDGCDCAASTASATACCGARR